MRTRKDINEKLREFARGLLFVVGGMVFLVGPIFALDWFFPGFGKWAAITLFGALGAILAVACAVEVYRFCRDWWTDGGQS